MKFFPKAKFDDALDALEMVVAIAKKPQTVQVKILGSGRRWADDFRREMGINY